MCHTGGKRRSVNPRRLGIVDWSRELDFADASPDSRQALRTLGLAVADLRGDGDFAERGRALLSGGAWHLWTGMGNEDRAAVRELLAETHRLWNWPWYGGEAYEALAQSFAERVRSAHQHYASAELQLEAVADVEGCCAHQEALAAIRVVNDAVGHIRLAVVPEHTALAHIQETPAPDLEGLLRRMRAASQPGGSCNTQHDDRRAVEFSPDTTSGEWLARPPRGSAISGRGDPPTAGRSAARQPEARGRGLRPGFEGENCALEEHPGCRVREVQGALLGRNTPRLPKKWLSGANRFAPFHPAATHARNRPF